MHLSCISPNFGLSFIWLLDAWKIFMSVLMCVSCGGTILNCSVCLPLVYSTCIGWQSWNGNV